ncbi:MAG: hypothetical protein A2Y57_03175 [Candidatus Woykebacteria bacterium RBG_13_40_7b]|uniref:Crossover junction endodeoxyribonuclease RuvC n=1 Tax=Candidatus Woykebacteria bacterium RBG_13_40_7b TaxID=1802594 RepID=A0A1G1W665_9BACT|nr:MAG: hypothetical protein A2Y57_03175 [Candidatus Woykebacteria bacterium RBG_13_40_7b]
MKILGVDPGTATTGWAILSSKTPAVSDQPEKKKKSAPNGLALNLESYGCIVTEPGEEMPKRLLILNRSLRKIIKEKRPDCLSLERIFFGANSKTAITVGQARGVIMLTAAAEKVPVFEYQGLQVKQHLTKYGRASKIDVQKAVIKILNIKKIDTPEDQNGKLRKAFLDDSVDAIALAIFHTLR